MGIGLHALMFAIKHLQALAQVAHDSGETPEQYMKSCNSFIAQLVSDLNLKPWRDSTDIELLRQAAVVFAYSEGVLK